MTTTYAAVDSTGNTADASYSGNVDTNGTRWQQPGPYSGGVKNYSVLRPSFRTDLDSSAGSFQALEFWVNYLNAPASTFSTFINNSTAGSATYAFGTRNNASNPQALTSQSSGFLNTVLSGVFPWGGWHHFVATRISSNHWDIYFDAVLIGTNIACDEGASSVFLIGTGSGTTVPAYMAGVAVYGSPLGNGQIAAHYAARTTNADYKAAVLGDSPLALWMLDEPTDAIVTTGFYDGTITMGPPDYIGPLIAFNSSVVAFRDSMFGLLCVDKTDNNTPPTATHSAMLPYKVVEDASSATGLRCIALNKGYLTDWQTFTSASGAWFPKQFALFPLNDHQIVWHEYDNNHGVSTHPFYVRVTTLLDDDGTISHSASQLVTVDAGIIGNGQGPYYCRVSDSIFARGYYATGSPTLVDAIQVDATGSCTILVSASAGNAGASSQYAIVGYDPNTGCLMGLSNPPNNPDRNIFARPFNTSTGYFGTRVGGLTNNFSNIGTAAIEETGELQAHTQSTNLNGVSWNGSTWTVPPTSSYDNSAFPFSTQAADPTIWGPNYGDLLTLRSARNQTTDFHFRWARTQQSAGLFGNVSIGETGISYASTGWLGTFGNQILSVTRHTSDVAVALLSVATDVFGNDNHTEMVAFYTV